MRVLARVNQTIPINDTVNFVTAQTGYRSCFLRAVSLGAATRLIVNNNESGFFQRIASLLTGNEDLNNGHYIWFPLTGDFLNLTTVGPAAINTTLTFYDEPPPQTQGFFLSDFRKFTLAALASNIGPVIAMGRYTRFNVVINTTLAAEFHTDQLIDGVTAIPDVFPSFSTGATGGTISGTQDLFGPNYQIRCTNLDAANPNDITLAVFVFNQ